VPGSLPSRLHRQTAALSAADRFIMGTIPAVSVGIGFDNDFPAECAAAVLHQRVRHRKESARGSESTASTGGRRQTTTCRRGVEALTKQPGKTSYTRSRPSGGQCGSRGVADPSRLPLQATRPIHLFMRKCRYPSSRIPSHKGSRRGPIQGDTMAPDDTNIRKGVGLAPPRS
jgi:hypothetical protein